VTSEELEKRNVTALGEVAGKQYSLLNNEVAILHLYWKEYVELFSTNQKRIDRLNQTAPGFFRMLQTELFQTNILHLARLTDPPKTGNKENLSLQKLPELVTDVGLKKTLTDLLAIVAEKTEFCRDWRNRRFAHHDLALATGASAIPLENANKEKLNEALKALADVINAIEGHYFKNFTSFEHIAGNKGAATLLYVLGDGVKASERRQKAIADGKFDELDNPEQI
jgi:AbiU2